jgi:hypothetical protein
MNNSDSLEDHISRSLQKFQKQYGTKKDDYYGLAFFENVLKVQTTTALDQIAFGNHDLGIDGFYFDKEQEQFRIFQFKNSKSVSLFNISLESLIERGLPGLFGDYMAIPDHQPVVDAARRALSENRDEISQVLVDFVFRGDPQEAQEKSAVSNLTDRLKEKADWLLERYFGEQVPLQVRFLNFDRLFPASTTDNFTIRMQSRIDLPGPNGMRMHVGFVPLIDLYAIRMTLGRRFLERNIRFALPPDGHVNRALSDTFAAILLKKKQVPSVFPIHHNGITLSAGLLESKGPGSDEVVVYAPRLLNGAQTVSTFADFWERNAPALRTADAEELIGQLVLLCRVITSASTEAVTQITISNNRQNPVKAWQLHANDQIQFELADYFKTLGILRRPRSFEQNFRVDMWNVCRGYAATRNGSFVK